MSINVHVDVSKAIAELRKQFYDPVNPNSNAKFNLAIARAINHTLAKAKTAASRDIRSEYNVKAKELKSALAINKASRKWHEGMLIATGRPLPLIAFGARQTRKGVTVNVMGQRKLVRGAFIATMQSGHRGAFARGKYSGYQFEFRNKRIKKQGNDLAINELTTTSVPKMMQNNAVLTALQKGLEQDFPARLEHEMSRLLTRKGS